MGLHPARLAAQALRPFEIDLGPFKQAGFRMFRVKWAARSAEEKILELQRGRRRRARAALSTMLAEESEYSLHGEAQEVPAEAPRATKHERKRPLQNIETTGLECALWPHLY